MPTWLRVCVVFLPLLLLLVVLLLVAVCRTLRPFTRTHTQLSCSVCVCLVCAAGEVP